MTTKLRDVLLPKPFVGVVPWMLFASVVTCCVTMCAFSGVRLRERWTDRTHEVVAREEASLPARGLRLGLVPARDGTEPGPPGPEYDTSVSKVELPGGDVRIRIQKSDPFSREVVELETVRATKEIRAHIESHEDMYPQPPPAWTDIDGHVAIKSWDFPRVKPLVLEYTLYGVRGGRRQCIHDSVVIDL